MSKSNKGQKPKSTLKDMTEKSDFLCDFRFRNELPDPSAKAKFLQYKRDPDRYCVYKPTSLEKNWKPQLDLQPDFDPLGLLDMSVYNPPKGEKIPLDPMDEELLRDDDEDLKTPIKEDGLRKKERPSEKGISWLLSTEYISPHMSTKQPRSGKKAKELRESQHQKKLSECLTSREREILDIMASFQAARSEPVHNVNSQLKPRKVLPLYPQFDGDDGEFVIAKFDSSPTADSETYKKLDAADRLECESKAIMKSRMAPSSSAEKTDSSWAYMVPSIDELKGKKKSDENEEVSYSWLGDYHCNAQSDKVDDPNTYILMFGESDVKYLPVPEKLILKKETAEEGKSGEEVLYPVPKEVIVKTQSRVAEMELNARDLRVAEGSKTSTSGSGSGSGSASGSGSRRGRRHRMTIRRR